MSNTLPTDDSFNQPRACLVDLVALLVKANSNGAVTDAFFGEGMSDAFDQALESALDTLGQEGRDQILKRYDITVAQLDAVCPAKPEVGEGHSAIELSFINLANLIPEAKRYEEVMDWVQDNASYAHADQADDFIINLACAMSDVPEELMPLMQEARKRGFGFINVYSD